MLTNKDFVKLAEILDLPDTDHYLIERVADWIEDDMINYKFDREGFYIRAGMRRREEREERHRKLAILERREVLKKKEERLRELTNGEYPHKGVEK